MSHQFIKATAICLCLFLLAGCASGNSPNEIQNDQTADTPVAAPQEEENAPAVPLDEEIVLPIWADDPLVKTREVLGFNLNRYPLKMKTDQTELQYNIVRTKTQDGLRFELADHEGNILPYDEMKDLHNGYAIALTKQKNPVEGAHPSTIDTYTLVNYDYEKIIDFEDYTHAIYFSDSGEYDEGKGAYINNIYYINHNSLWLTIDFNLGEVISYEPVYDTDKPMMYNLNDFSVIVSPGAFGGILNASYNGETELRYEYLDVLLLPVINGMTFDLYDGNTPLGAYRATVEKIIFDELVISFLGFEDDELKPYGVLNRGFTSLAPYEQVSSEGYRSLLDQYYLSHNLSPELKKNVAIYEAESGNKQVTFVFISIDEEDNCYDSSRITDYEEMKTTLAQNGIGFGEVVLYLPDGAESKNYDVLYEDVRYYIRSIEKRYRMSLFLLAELVEEPGYALTVRQAAYEGSFYRTYFLE